MVNQNYIWYVSYGSNINIERFYCYIFGGIPKYTNKNHIGSKIKENPVQQSGLKIPYELYFSKSADVWENKAVAFIRSIKNNSIETLCNAYLIHKKQFVDILLQENNRNPFNENIFLDFTSIIENEEYFLPPDKENIYYGRIIYLGEFKNYKAFTFTAKWDDNDIEYAMPGNNYLKTIIEGIKKIYNISSTELTKYLINLGGINGYMDTKTIENLINSIEL